MAPIVETVEIARSPEDVFAYLNQLDRHGEWQEQIVSAKIDGPGPVTVGTRATEVRRMGKREMTITYEVTAQDPPRSFAFRGLDGNVRVNGKGRVQPVGDGSRSRVTIELDMVGYGIGKLLVPLARGQARKQVPKDQQRLKEILESGGA